MNTVPVGIADQLEQIFVDHVKNICDGDGSIAEYLIVNSHADWTTQWRLLGFYYS